MELSAWHIVQKPHSSQVTGLSRLPDRANTRNRTGPRATKQQLDIARGWLFHEQRVGSRRAITLTHGRTDQTVIQLRIRSL